MLMSIVCFRIHSFVSCLIIHIDIEFITTEGNIWPTHENSRPIVEGDNQGRGSFVFFNQSTMCQGPVTSCDTMIEAVENGHSGKVDYGKSIQDTFTRLLVLTPISPGMLH
jgi:hypothetical protein